MSSYFCKCWGEQSMWARLVKDLSLEDEGAQEL